MIKSFKKKWYIMDKNMDFKSFKTKTWTLSTPTKAAFQKNGRCLVLHLDASACHYWLLVGLPFTTRIFGDMDAYGWFQKWGYPKKDGLQWKTLLNGWFGGTPIFGNTHLFIYSNILDLPLTQDSSGKQRFRLRFPLLKNVILVVTGTGWGVDPKYKYYDKYV